MPKFSQIAPAGAPPAVTDQAVFVTGGATDNLVTVTQLGAALPIATTTTRGQVPVSGGGTTAFLRADISFAVPPNFTSTTPGYAPLSGGGTTNFLRADGTWAPPPAGTPGGSTLQIQYNNAGAFGGANVWRTTADQLDLSDTAVAQALRIYNTTDNNGGAPTNAEWGFCDWVTNTNTFNVGCTKSGTGTLRDMILSGGSQIQFWVSNLTARVGLFTNSGAQFKLANNFGFTWSSTSDATGGQDTGLTRVAAKVIAAGDGGANANGWIQTQGMQRVGSDIGFTSNVALATIMTVNVQANRNYTFDTYLSITGSAGGVQAAVSGTATTTDVRYDGYVIDNAAGGTKGAAQAAALGTVVANPATITGPASAVIRGTVTTSGAGTLTIQASQSTSSGTTTTIKRGSWVRFEDVP